MLWRWLVFGLYSDSITLHCITVIVPFDSGDDSRQCYVVGNETVCYFKPTNIIEMNWDDASKFCRDNNATLPVILNSNHQRTIEKYLEQFSQNKSIVFTAGRKSWSIDPHYPWRWVNGKQSRSMNLL